MLAGKTVLPVGSGENLLVVKDVPALGCEQCGEPFVEIGTVRIVEELVANAEQNGVMLGYIKFKSAA